MYRFEEVVDEDVIRREIERAIAPKRVLELRITRSKRGIVSIDFRTDVVLEKTEEEKVESVLRSITGLSWGRLRRVMSP